MNIVFFDGAADMRYTASSLDSANNGIGGAEATLARIAIGLAGNGADITVVQTAAGDSDGMDGGVRWVGAAVADKIMAEADIIVVQRRIADAWAVRRKNKKASIFVWYHDWYSLRGVSPTGSVVKTVARNIVKANVRALMHLLGRIRMIAVSETHKSAIADYFAYSPLAGAVKSSETLCQVIYNPVSKSFARPAGIEVDRNKLIYFSAPWKGLAVVKQAFARLSQQIPEMRLYVASPSYGYEAEENEAAAGNIVNLGSLTQAELAAHVSGSLCVFYPSRVIPETFGLVFVESHALGTPVLAHAFGAAPEMLTPAELVDSADHQQIFERISAWREGQRPVVGAQTRFDRDQVLARWTQVLGLAPGRA